MHQLRWRDARCGGFAPCSFRSSESAPFPGDIRSLSGACSDRPAAPRFRLAFAERQAIACRLSLLVGLGGLEPPTSRLSGVCSNLLSYQPILRQNPPFCSFLPFDKPSLFGRLLLFSIKAKLLWKPPEFLHPGGSLLRNNLLFPYTSALLDPLSTYLRYAHLLSFLWVLPSLAL